MASSLCFLVTVLALSVSGCGSPLRVDEDGSIEPSPPNAGIVSFRGDVLPVLAEHCTKCHHTSFRGDYRSAETAWPALTGPVRALPFGFGCAESPPTGLVVPGDPDVSALWQLCGIGFDATGECPGHSGMPKNDPRGILADFDSEDAEIIRRWIELGARND